MPLRNSFRRLLALSRTVMLRGLAGFAMFTLFVICAFGAMRMAIHGREVNVPDLANLSDTDAAAAASKLGLNLSVENRFYAATVPVNHILSQSPLPGSRVRRGWQIRVTESLGAQQVAVPDVTGQEEQPATLMLRRLQLEVGAVAHIPGPSPAGVVLAQSPPPNVAGLDGPRVSILVADDQTALPATGYVMPSLLGLTLRAAQARVSSAGLHIAVPSAADQDVSDGESQPDSSPVPDPAIPPTVLPAHSHNAVITSQSPLPGQRVSRSANIHVALSE